MNTACEKLLKQTCTDDKPGEVRDRILLLQYGSAFLEADDTDNSDFDVLMVAKNVDM